MNQKVQKLISTLGQSRVTLAEPLLKYSSFHLGGPAEFFYRAKTIDELMTAINTANIFKIPYFILGGGTNLLISDFGFAGLVIKNDTSEINLLGIKGKTYGKGNAEISQQTVYLQVESGVSVNRLVRFTLDQGFAGLQFFLGQPGTVGGATYINAHNMKKGQFFGDTIVEAKILKATSRIEKVSSKYFCFGYDKSILQNTHETLLSVVIQLERKVNIDLWKEAQEALEYRQETQPTGFFSSGCTFRNISKSQAMNLATPNYTTSAGYLIERVGLKGTKIGGAMFSKNHANFIVHKGEAKSSDVLELIKLAKEKVKNKFNINLEEEIILVGEFKYG
ncbi:UDP-N-acetylmuramate dehydrogenase [Candidatus Gottesmanbacteria bacterium]|nr:UDP-N-acetylmuramate dehydrogenase [Candidatus Gottesmanbacteria bacterium]